jgi:hypothetical protein
VVTIAAAASSLAAAIAVEYYAWSAELLRQVASWCLLSGIVRYIIPDLDLLFEISAARNSMDKSVSAQMDEAGKFLHNGSALCMLHVACEIIMLP